jgi:DNA-binding SARP family transcriptional activator
MAESAPRPTHRLRTLGTIELTAAEGPLLPGHRKTLGLLAFLARRSPRAFPRAELAALLWGERDEARGRQSLRHAISQIRGAIGDVLESHQSDVRIRPGAVELDVVAFEEAVGRHFPEEAAALWGGDFLPGADDLGGGEWRAWLEAEREALRRKAGSVFRQLSEHAAADGQPATAEEWARRWVESMPWDDEAVQRLAAMQLHAERAGRAHRAARMGPGRRGLLSPALVGREDVLGRLAGEWRGVREGAAAVVVVQGEDGLGKSRLAHDFARDVRRGSSPALVLEARAYSSEQGRDWGTLALLVRQMAGGKGLPAVRPSALAALAGLAPEIRDRLPGLPAGPGVSLEAAFPEAIRVLAEEQPILLLLDDAPLADAATLQAIVGLLHERPPRVLVLLTGRTWTMAESPLAADLRQGAYDVVTISLPPLDAGGVEALIESMAPIAAGARTELASALRVPTGGVPGHLVEVIARLAEEGVLAPDDSGRWQLARPLADATLSPPSVREATVERLRRLDPAPRAVLEAAAVAGPVVDPVLLEAMAGLAPANFQQALADVLLRRFLRESPSSPGQLEFASETARRAAYEYVAPSRRRALHRAAARALRDDGGDPDRKAIARQHRRLGGVDGRWKVGLPVAAATMLVAALGLRGLVATPREGADHRLLVVAFENETGDESLDWLGRVAADWLSQGVGRTGLVKVAPPWLDAIPEDARERAGARSRAMTVARDASASLVISGSYHRSGDSVHFRASVADAREGRLLRVVGPVGSPVAGVMTAIDSLRRSALAALAPWVDERLSATAAVQGSPPTYEAYRVFAEGLDYFYRRDGRSVDYLLQAYALDTTYTAPLLYAVWQYEGLGDFAGIDSLLAILRPRRAELAPYDQLALDIQVAHARGDWAAEYAAARQAAQLAPGSFAAAHALPRAALALNRPREALEYLLRMDDGGGEPSRLPVYWAHVAAASHMLGDYHGQLRVGREVRRRFPTDVRSYAYQARALAALGRFAELDAVLEESLLLPIEPSWGAVGLEMHRAAAWELLAHGHPVQAQRVLDRALRFCDEAPAALGEVRRHQFECGMVEFTTGRLAEARARFEALLAEGGAIGATPVHLRARIGMAAAMQGDSATARGMLRWLERPKVDWPLRGENTEFRAGINALLGRRDAAVRLLHQAMAEGRAYDSGKHAYLEYAGLRGYKPFEEWLRPK